MLIEVRRALVVAAVEVGEVADVVDVVDDVDVVIVDAPVPFVAATPPPPGRREDLAGRPVLEAD